MEQQLFTKFLSEGIFLALFIWLLIDTKKDSKQREIKYQDTINKNQEVIKELADKISIVEEIKEDVEEIKNKLR